MRRLIMLSLCAALLASGLAAAQERQRLPADCRREVMALCRGAGGRDAIRACVRNRIAELSEDCRTAIVERALSRGRGEAARGDERARPASGGSELSFGSDARQRLDYWPAARPGDGAAPPPLVLFIHGGGWSIGDKRQGAGDKPAYYTGLGYAFASTNYRLVPDVTPADQAADIAAAIAMLRRDAAQLGHDPDRIVLMGHSAGAHLAALVATDERYLAAAGVPMQAIAGVVLLDGAGYDVPRQMAGARLLTERLYRPAFSDDPARQRALSPITHTGGSDARRWLILHVAERADAADQSRRLAEALRSGGATVDLHGIAGASHMSVNRDAGRAGTTEGEAIAGFLRRIQ